jgi:hypothetical protein
MESGAWRELVGACRDLLRADCRQHRERATQRIRKLMDRLNGAGDPRDKAYLLRDLALYAQEFDEDPEAAKLVSRCREYGVLPKVPHRG